MTRFIETRSCTPSISIVRVDGVGERTLNGPTAFSSSFVRFLPECRTVQLSYIVGSSGLSGAANGRRTRAGRILGLPVVVGVRRGNAYYWIVKTKVTP